MATRSIELRKVTQSIDVSDPSQHTIYLPANGFDGWAADNGRRNLCHCCPRCFRHCCHRTSWYQSHYRTCVAGVCATSLFAFDREKLDRFFPSDWHSYPALCDLRRSDGRGTGSYLQNEHLRSAQVVEDSVAVLIGALAASPGEVELGRSELGLGSQVCRQTGTVAAGTQLAAGGLALARLSAGLLLPARQE